LSHPDSIVLRYFHQGPPDDGAGREAAFRRWVVLSDHEQRALEDLERSFATEVSEPVRAGRATRRSPRRPNRPPGYRVVVVLACVSVALVFGGVPAAALALALATAIVWSFWRLWSHRTGDGSFPLPPHSDADEGHDRADRRPGESIRRYFTWLAE
jgi:ferric-dicitrate binding protein FerR (iron transport regulator)